VTAEIVKPQCRKPRGYQIGRAQIVGAVPGVQAWEYFRKEQTIYAPATPRGDLQLSGGSSVVDGSVYGRCSANSPVPVPMPRSSLQARSTAATTYGSNEFSHDKADSLPQSTDGRRARSRLVVLEDHEGVDVVKMWSSACAILVFAAGLTMLGAGQANATVCGSVGGARVDVSGCADPLSELNDALYAPPPPPPAPNVSVCVNAGRRISVSGCF
jgi:hypothetical protein